MDVARILGTTHTAQFQYIPALALSNRDTLNLRLNNPPSFRNPKSVIVSGSRRLSNAVPPPLKASGSKQITCLAAPKLVLPVEGAPLIFATELAHELTLHLQNSDKGWVDLPAEADPGAVVDRSKFERLSLPASTRKSTGRSTACGGFRISRGHDSPFRSPSSAKLVVASKDASALIIGREDTLHLQVEDAACVKDIIVRDERHNKLVTTWKKSKPDELELHIPLKDAGAGALQVEVDEVRAARAGHDRLAFLC